MEWRQVETVNANANANANAKHVDEDDGKRNAVVVVAGGQMEFLLQLGDEQRAKFQAEQQRLGHRINEVGC